ncbi:MAG: hypothetical protein WC967_09375 [Balneolaceae bacterium]
MQYQVITDILDKIFLEFQWSDTKKKQVNNKELGQIRRFVEDNTSPYLKFIQAIRPIRNKFFTPELGSHSKIKSPNGSTFAKYEKNSSIFNTVDVCIFSSAQSANISDINAAITDFLEYEPNLLAECIFNSNVGTVSKQPKLANFLCSLLYNNLSKTIDVVKQGQPHKLSPLLVIGKEDSHIDSQDGMDYVLGVPYLQVESLPPTNQIAAFVNTIPKSQSLTLTYNEGIFTLLMHSYYANISQYRVYLGSNER